jgi:hypothetical protein
VIESMQESSNLNWLQGIPGRSKRKMTQGVMVEMIFHSFEAWVRRSQCLFGGASPGVTFEWTALLERQRQSQQRRWCNCPMAFSQVCVMISIAGGSDLAEYHSLILQWHPHQRESIQSSHGLFWNAATTVQSLFVERRFEPIYGS